MQLLSQHAETGRFTLLPTLPQALSPLVTVLTVASNILSALTWKNIEFFLPYIKKEFIFHQKAINAH